MTVDSGLLVLGGLVLHIGSHVTESASSTSTFDWRITAASVVLVGGVGGLLYWYYGRQVEPGPPLDQSRKQ